MRKPAMTSDASAHRGTAALTTAAIGLVAAASVGVMLWGAGSHNVLSASEVGGSVARAAPTTLAAVTPAPTTLEDHVNALTAELAQVRREIATLREGHNDSSAELSHLGASVAKAEIGLSALRITTAENETRRLEEVAQIASNLADLKEETLHLRTALDDTATGVGALRVSAASSEIGLDSLRASTTDIRQRIERIEVATEATSSIGKRHRHRSHSKWVAVR